jgi:hypothetical protein
MKQREQANIEDIIGTDDAELFRRCQLMANQALQGKQARSPRPSAAPPALYH